ncbi:actin-like ATPase domain-containing protein, partial [Aureobasidium melanogenum]
MTCAASHQFGDPPHWPSDAAGCSVPWDPLLHSPKNKFVDRITKELRAKNQMLWYVERGQDMPSDEPILLSLTDDFWPGEGFGSEHGVKIVVSDAEEPPQEYEPTNETRALCTLNTDLDKIFRKYFQRQVAHGQSYYSLHWKSGMTLDGRLTLDRRIDDKVYGSIEAVYT